MKKILFWFFSVVLTASAAAPASAQLLAKKGAADAPVASAMKKATINRSKVHVADVRSSKFQAIPGALQQARTNVAAKTVIPAYEGAAVPNLKGYVGYSDEWAGMQEPPVGVYSIPRTADADFEFLFGGVDATRGGVAVDGVYYSTRYFSILGFVIVTTTATDIETGEKIGEWSPGIDAIGVGGYTLDPSTGDVYGITFNAEGSGLQLSKLTFGEDVEVEAIAALDGNWNSIAADKDGVLYGISYEGTESGDNFIVTSSTLVKFDKTNGTYETIGETGQIPQYLSSATIDPVSNRMFWNVCNAAEEGLLCEVNLTTGAATVLYALPGNAQIFGMYTEAPAANPKAPAAVTNLSASFPEGKLTGSLTFTVPTTLYDGTPATGNVKYKVTANGDLVDLASVAYGETVTIEPVTVYETGMVNFVVVLTNEEGDSPKAKCNYFVGNGVPNAPKNVKAEYDGTKMNVTWDAVTASADGGYVNPDEVTYTVYGHPGSAEPLVKDFKGLSYTQTFTAPEDFTTYYYEVVANFDKGSSVAGVSNRVFLGALNTPYEVTFDNASALDPFTVIDANGDGKTWVYNDKNIRVAYNSRAAMDDWLISAPLRMKAGYAYYVSVDAWAGSKTFGPERMEIMAGTAATVDAMTLQVLPATELYDINTKTYGNYFVAPADGTYHIGVHGISDADMLYLYVSKFSVAEGVPATVPSAGTISAVADPSGAYKAAINVTTPALDLVGNPVSALTKAEIYRGETLVHTFNAPAASTALSFNDVLEGMGTYTYTFVAYNADGKGKEVSTSVFVGTGKPATPENVYLQETEMPGYLTISWDAVNTDVEGNPINPANVTYSVHTITADGYLGDVIVSDLHITAYTFDAFDPEGEQEFAQYALVAETEGGSVAVTTDMIPVGKAYDGLNESFPGGTLGYIWGVSTDGSYLKWSIATDETFGDVKSVDGDGGFIIAQGQYVGDNGSLISGKVLVGEDNPVLSFYTLPVAADNTSTIAVNVRDVKGEYETLYSTELGQLGNDLEWVKVTLPLTAFAGKNIQFEFVVEANENGYAIFAFDQIFVGRQPNYDLVVSEIIAPAKVTPGQEYNVEVKVVNEGAKLAENFKVELYKDGEVEEVKEVASLASGANTIVSFEQAMSGVAVDPVSYKAVVVFDADENVENNETELTVVEPIISKLPAVKNLIGEGAQNGNILRWEEPELTIAKDGTQDFEDATAFAHNMEGWTFVDADQSPVGGFQGSDIPGITPGSTTASFFVFDNDVFGGNQTFEAHSGSKYLAALFRYDDGQVDDWAISPELSTKAQTISFWAKSYSAQYPETIEVLYSMTGKEIADFTAVEGSKVTGLSADWTEYTAALPEGAKYFAIRSMASGSFMLMIDDVTFEGADAEIELSIAGYEVYRDGVKINAGIVTECEYLDTDVTLGKDYNYAVVPVFDLGAGYPAFVDVTSGVDDVEAGIVITTADKNIVVLGAEGLEVVVSAVDGKVLYAAEGTAKTVVPATNGIYIVKAGNKVAKVIVK